ncbi:hypothetical protein CPB83DRAFT_851229, partial [Crepidotus variabilis]
MTNPGSQRTPLKKSQNPNVEYFLARQVLGIFKAVDGLMSRQQVQMTAMVCRIARLRV